MPHLPPERNVRAVYYSWKENPEFFFNFVVFFLDSHSSHFIYLFSLHQVKKWESGDVFYADIVVEFVLKATTRSVCVSCKLATSSANNHLDITNCSSNCSSNIFLPCTLRKTIIEKRANKQGERRMIESNKNEDKKQKGIKNNGRNTYAILTFSALPLTGVVFVPCTYNRSKTIANFTYSAPMPLQNESKSNDSRTKKDSPKQNIKVLMFLMIFRDF
jgi:hypothetical protein